MEIFRLKVCDLSNYFFNIWHALTIHHLFTFTPWLPAFIFNWTVIGQGKHSNDQISPQWTSYKISPFQGEFLTTFRLFVPPWSVEERANNAHFAQNKPEFFPDFPECIKIATDFIYVRQHRNFRVHLRSDFQDIVQSKWNFITNELNFDFDFFYHEIK